MINFRFDVIDPYCVLLEGIQFPSWGLHFVAMIIIITIIIISSDHRRV